MTWCVSLYCDACPATRKQTQWVGDPEQPLPRVMEDAEAAGWEDRLGSGLVCPHCAQATVHQDARSGV